MLTYYKQNTFFMGWGGDVIVLDCSRYYFKLPVSIMKQVVELSELTELFALLTQRT